MDSSQLAGGVAILSDDQAAMPIQNLNTDALMMEPAEDWSRRDSADLLPSPGLWSILSE